MKRFGESDVLYPTSIPSLFLVNRTPIVFRSSPSSTQAWASEESDPTLPLEMDLTGLSLSQSLGHLPMTG